MNKFIKKILVEKGQMKKAIQSPLINGFEYSEIAEYQPRTHRTQYHFRLDFKFDAWIDENQERNQHIIEEIRALAIKRLNSEIFGQIESYMHELQLHLHNEDYAACLDVVSLIKAEIRGD
jgi:hypothetical protein